MQIHINVDLYIRVYNRFDLISFFVYFFWIGSIESSLNLLEKRFSSISQNVFVWVLEQKVEKYLTL